MPRAAAGSGAVVPEFRNFVGDEFVRGDRFFDDLNPSDGTVIARVSEAGPAVVDAAIKAARRALQGEWGNAGVRQRAALLYKIADGIEARFDELVQAESADTGKPVALASRLDVPRAAANFRVFADLVKTAALEAFETETPEGAELRRPQAGRRRRYCYAVESSTLAADVEGRSCAGLRQHCSGEAIGGNPRQRYLAGGGDARCRSAQRRL